MDTNKNLNAAVNKRKIVHKFNENHKYLTDYYNKIQKLFHKSTTR